MRSDGLLVFRDQALDTHNDQAKQLKEIYEDILEQADEGGKKKPSGSTGLSRHGW